MLQYYDIHNQIIRDDTHVLASTDSRSILYRFKDDGEQPSFTELNESLAGGLNLEERTLAFSNVIGRTVKGNGAAYCDSSLVVQVTPSRVSMVEYDSTTACYTEKARFTPADMELKYGRHPTEITAASINHSQIALAFNLGVVALLNYDDRGFKLVA